MSIWSNVSWKALSQIFSASGTALPATSSIIDPSGFKAKVEARFNIGSTEVNTVLSTVDDPADAYIVFRMGEMSGNTTEDVIRRYKSGKGKGWGVLAKSLGIKPGSKEFNALKNGEDFKEKQYTYNSHFASCSSNVAN